jgi:hypothetical protein
MVFAEIQPKQGVFIDDPHRSPVVLGCPSGTTFTKEFNGTKIEEILLLVNNTNNEYIHIIITQY